MPESDEIIARCEKLLQAADDACSAAVAVRASAETAYCAARSAYAEACNQAATAEGARRDAIERLHAARHEALNVLPAASIQPGCD